MDDWQWHKGKSIRVCTDTCNNFKEVVEEYENLAPDVNKAAMKVASSVVSIICRSGTEVLCVGSGIIIEFDEQHGFATILTSATLLEDRARVSSLSSDLKIDVYLSDGKLYEAQVLLYNFYYNIATIKIESSTPLSTASICDDGDPSTGAPFDLCPEELVIALGRDCLNRHDIMVSPGVFSARDCRHDCTELFWTTCVVTKLAVGGPLVNYDGDVIGVNFFICPFAAFVPITIVCRCLEDLKGKGQVPRPWLGVRVANLDLVNLDKLDMLRQKFPGVSKGVIVEQIDGNNNISCRRKQRKVLHRPFWSARKWLKTKAIVQKIKQKGSAKPIMGQNKRTTSWSRRQVIKKSPASLSGLHVGDIIVKCGEIVVRSHLEFVDALWEKEGKPVELVLVRPSVGELRLTLTVGTCPVMPRWLLFERAPPSLTKYKLDTERKIKSGMMEYFDRQDI